MLLLKAGEIETTYAGIARKLGASADDAEILATCLLRADLRGFYTQGAALIPYVVSMLRERLMDFAAPFEILRDTPACTVVDGHHGVGPVTSMKAMDIAVRKAKECGVGCVWLRNGGDFAMASNYVLRALESGCVGISSRNGSPRVAPWGARDAFFGTDPVSVAIPASQEAPIVIDMAPGSFSVGHVVFAARDRRLVENAYLVDEMGRYTDDPLSIVVDPADRESSFRGAIVSAGHKGYCSLLIVELLTGLLAGLGTSSQNDFPPTSDKPWQEGSFFMAIDVNSLLPLDEFKTSTDQLVSTLRAMRPAKGFDGVLVPGEHEAKYEESRRREGVPVREEDWAAVVQCAVELGIGQAET